MREPVAKASHVFNGAYSAAVVDAQLALLQEINIRRSQIPADARLPRAFSPDDHSAGMIFRQSTLVT
jgi:hypothetical protein